MKDRSFFRGLLKLLTVLVLAIIILAVFKANCEIRTITVTGTLIYDDREIWEKTSGNPLDIYAPFYVMTVNRGRYEPIPFIEQIDAKLAGPNSVELTVYEKKVIGCIYAMSGYFYFDRDGMIVEYSEEKLENIMMVTGAAFDSIVVGKNLKVIDNRHYFEIVSGIVMALEREGLICDEIYFDYERAVILKIGETDIRLGSHDDYGTAVSALPEILEALTDSNMVLYMENYSENNRTVQAKPKAGTVP